MRDSAQKGLPLSSSCSSPAAAGVQAGRDWLDAARVAIDPALRAAVGRLDEPNRRVAGYHLGFLDADGAAADRSRGKGVRGALALLSARAAGAGVTAGVPAAVACELVHEASLLHDDIVDRDTVRRGAPAAWTVFGAARAILAGDALLALAMEVLTDAAVGAPSADAPDTPPDAPDVPVLDTPDSPAPDTADAPRPASVAAAVRALAGANRRLLAGQAADLAFEARAEVGVEECLAMVADKTGALLSCAAGLGAVLAGGPDTLITDLADYGRRLGVAFQLVDDLLGIWGAPDRTGKPVWSDLQSRKKSLPVVAALGSGSVAGQRLSEIYGMPGELDDALLAEAAGAVEEAGGRAWAAALAERETRAALEIVAALDVSEPVRADLVALADLLGGRDR